MEFFINTNFESTDIINYLDSLFIYTKNKKILKIFINVEITGIIFVDIGLHVYTDNKVGEVVEINYGKNNIKKQYDGTYIISIDVSKINCYDFIEVTVIRGNNFITVNNLTLEYEESFLSIDYKSFKNAISNYIY